MNRIVQPVVRLALAQVLNEHFGMRGVKAVAVSTKIIELLMDKDVYLVKGDWMNAEKPEFRWEDLAQTVAAYEEMGYTPWNSPELR